MADVPVQLEFTLEPTTDPVGAHLRVAVPDAPTEDSRQALLDGMAEALVEARDNLVFQAVQNAHDNLDSYGATHDYATDSIVDSFDGVELDRSRTALDIQWAWAHEAALYFEYGTSDHTIEGTPLLSFIWEDIPQEAADQLGVDRDGGDARVVLPEVEVSGLPEGRWLRDSLNEFRRNVGQQ